MKHLVAAVLIAGLASLSSAGAQEASPVLFDFAPKFLRVSEVMPGIGSLQTRLNDALTECGKAGVTVDYKPGGGTARAIARLRDCPGFQIEGEEGLKTLTTALWEKLWPGTPAPGAAERIGVLVLTSENTDYDTFLWNVGQPGDPWAWGTWGPFGATIASGQEVQKIAKRLEADHPGLIADAFANATFTGRVPPTNWRTNYCATTPHQPPQITGADLLLGLPTSWTNGEALSATDKQNLINAFCDDAEFIRWYAAFQQFGGAPEGVAAFDAHYTDQNRRAVNIFGSRYEARGLPITEADWAFFLDRATQFSGRAAMAMVDEALDGLPATASPAERRRAIMRTSQPSKASHKRLRTGRDMIFLVDSFSLDQFTEEELDAWRWYGARRVSQIGLSDLDAPSPF